LPTRRAGYFTFCAVIFDNTETTAALVGSG
jgi:hypothetical protein